jgi:hypothetical protein
LRTPSRLLPFALILACANTAPGEDDPATAEQAPEEVVPRSPLAADENADEPTTIKLTLPGLDLVADAPPSAELRDASLGEGVTIHDAELSVRVELAGEQTPTTLAEAKTEAELVAPAKLEEKILADGWAITFASASAMGPAYWVQVRREIGGRALWCTATGSSETRQTAALALCTSLRS